MRPTIIALISGLLLAGCGQAGPLYLPDRVPDDQKAPSQRKPADEPPVAAPAPSPPAPPAATP